MTEDSSNAWRKIASVFFPIFVIFFLQSLSKFMERICLSYYSLDALNGSMEAYAFLQFFQVSLVVFANTTQGFEGKKQAIEIGNRIWQIIWISLFSMFLIIPLGWGLDLLFFKGIHQSEAASSYFKISILGSFAFPIGAILSSFFNALDKRWLIYVALVISTQTSFILNLLLIPLLGVKGAAYSSLFSKLLFCLLLFGCFLSRNNQKHYHTHRWDIDWTSIWTSIRTYNPRFLGTMLTLLNWIVLTYYMANRGDIYASILSVGATLTFLAASFHQTIFHSLIALFSRSLRNLYDLKLRQVFKYGILGSSLGLVLASPLLLFPQAVISALFPKIPLELYDQITVTLTWAFIWISIGSIHAGILAFNSSACDDSFYVKLKCFIHIATLFQIHYLIHHLKWGPNAFWMALCIEYVILLSICAVRAYMLTSVDKKSLGQETLSG